MRCEGHAAPCSCAHRHGCCCWAAALARCPSETPSRRGCRGNPLALQARCPGSAVSRLLCSSCVRGENSGHKVVVHLIGPTTVLERGTPVPCKVKRLKRSCAFGFANRGPPQAVAAWQMARFVIRCGASPLTPARGSPAACCAAAAACCAASAAPAPAGPARGRVWGWGKG